MPVTAPSKKELEKPIRVMRDGLKSLERAEFHGCDAIPIAELMLFLKGLLNDTMTQHASMPNDTPMPQAEFGRQEPVPA